MAGCSSGSKDNPETVAAEKNSSAERKLPPLTPKADAKPPAQLVGVQLVTNKFPDGTPYIQREVKKYSDNSMVNHGRYATYYRGGQKFEEGKYVDGMKQGILENVA